MKKAAGLAKITAEGRMHERIAAETGDIAADRLDIGKLNARLAMAIGRKLAQFLARQLPVGAEKCCQSFARIGADLEVSKLIIDKLMEIAAGVFVAGKTPQAFSVFEQQPKFRRLEEIAGLGDDETPHPFCVGKRLDRLGACIAGILDEDCPPSAKQRQRLDLIGKPAG